MERKKPRRSNEQDPLVLASQSPQRKHLLEEAGIPFEACPQDVDETLPPGMPMEEAAATLALSKARAGHTAYPDRWVLGADTLVGLGERILGKPQDEAQAREMLSSLAGTTQKVVTGVAVIDPEGREWVAQEITRVSMRSLESREIEDYLASGEWRDKAGAYGIQGAADRFVTSLEGPLDNVIGLPVALVRKLLASAGHSG